MMKQTKKQKRTDQLRLSTSLNAKANKVHTLKNHHIIENNQHKSFNIQNWFKVVVFLVVIVATAAIAAAVSYSKH